jgi:predicted Zn-dependent protease
MINRSSFLVSLLLLLEVCLETGCRRSEPPKVLKKSALREARQGMKTALALERRYGTVGKPEQMERVNRIGFAIAQVSSRPLPWYSFNVLDVEIPNAMALPGGFVFVTRGLLEDRYTRLSDDEIACLLAHEIAHIDREHHHRAGKRAAGWSLLHILSIIAAAAEGGGEAVAATATAGGAFGALFQLSYSRELEAEADEIGIAYAARAGFDPAAMASLLQKLQDLGNEFGSEGSLWRSHPYLAERIQTARARATQTPRTEIPPSPGFFQNKTQQTLHDLAAWVETDEKPDASPKPALLSWILYRNALQAAPAGPLAVALHRQLLRRMREREQGKPDYWKDLGKVSTGYEEAIARLPEELSGAPGYEELLKEREEATAQRKSRYEQDCAILESGTAPIRFYEYFVENYADSPRRAETMFRLAEGLHLAGESTGAAEWHRKVWEEFPESDWASRSRQRMLELMDRAENAESLYSLWKSAPEAQRQRILPHLERALGKLSPLESASDLLQQHSDFPLLEGLHDRLGILARERYLQGQFHEGTRQPAKAREAYRSILLHAPHTEWAARAQGRLEGLRE